MSGSSPTLSLQTRINKLENYTRELTFRYSILTRQYLGIFGIEFILLAILLTDIYPWFIPGISINLNATIHLTLIAIQAMLFIMWQIFYMTNRDRFLKRYYQANALCGELTDHADWTNFYQRDPGSMTRRRLQKAVRDFNRLRTKELFPELTPLNRYTLLTGMLILLFIATTLLLLYQSETTSSSTLLR